MAVSAPDAVGLVGAGAVDLAGASVGAVVLLRGAADLVGVHVPVGDVVLDPGAAGGLADACVADLVGTPAGAVVLALTS